MQIDYTKIGRRGTLLSAIDVDDTTIQLTSPGAARLAPADGEAVLLTLTAGPLVEVVLCTARQGDLLSIQRGQDGTMAQAFPAGTCVQAAWNRGQMTSFILQQLATAMPSGYTGTITNGTQNIQVKNGIIINVGN